MKQKIGLQVLKYLRFWARLQLKKVNPIIIGITGSAGKTSTQKAVSLVLSQKGTVKESHKANSESGIPLNILGLKMNNYSVLAWLKAILLAPFAYIFNWKKYSYYVVEMGIDSPMPPKNMDYLLTILKPHVGIILNADLTHTETFDALVKDMHPKRREEKIAEKIAQEKGKLITTMGNHNVAIVNIDQKPLKNLISHTQARVLTYGKRKEAMIRIIQVKQGKGNFSMTIEYNGKEHKLTIKNIPLEKNYAYTFAASIAVGLSFGITPEKSVTKLSNSFSPPPGRWSIFEGKKDSHIIDSSYNAAPSTMKEALESLRNIASRSHKIAVIGDMRELGKESKKSHKDLANWVIANANEVFLFGGATKEHTLPILKQKKFPAKHYTTISTLTKQLNKSLKKNAWVLVKGSQNTLLLERAVEEILKNKKDISKLCRRGNYWDKVRQNTN